MIKKQISKKGKESDEKNRPEATLILILIAPIVIGVILFSELTKTKNNNELANTSLDKGNESRLYANLSTKNELPYLKVNLKQTGEILGSENSSIKIIEFGDFQCPYCKQFYEEQIPLLNTNYISKDKLSLSYLSIPFPSIHDKSTEASLAAFCADEQDDFWQMHNLLYQKQETWNRTPKELFINTLMNYAKELNLNQTSFKSCLESKKYQSRLDDEVSDGEKLSVSGTPTFFILIQKDKIKDLDFQSKFDQIRANSASGFALTPYQNENEYIVVVSGIVDYKTLKAVLDIS